ncbi:lysoplasmalogenase family protein [Brachybacterium tyrofermentans]|uniref:lysoplasmalogenase family protein n=1 Tax=Brachybacterium tyrofermentans TaxID=47848 RepID=UPI0018672982|nr:lysoplasmalogenase family protein [Brachybacterium tyrofermentans]
MPLIRSLHLALWGVYALVLAVHIWALLTGAEMIQRSTQPLFAPLLIAALVTALPRRTRTSTLTLLGLLFAWAGDSLSQLAPENVQLISVLCFLLALVCYATALAPLWNRTRDPMRIALAIPYGGVVIGLFVACADGSGPLLPAVAAYAVALATMAFLSAGGNGLTWTGGTLFLLSSSMLAMNWFLPGAAIAYSSVWVMASYAVGHALLIAGLVRTIPARRWAPACRAGAALVIVEN